LHGAVLPVEFLSQVSGRHGYEGEGRLPYGYDAFCVSRGQQKYAVPRICADASATRENAQDCCITLDTASRPRTALSPVCSVTSRRLTFEDSDRDPVKRSLS
jgi:hypothetical protein